ncbi:hypothetical protein BGX29_003325 [Mortierella sp. GBA35]|nr:hypothetical protein BGX29_003325 [Mortierella sp. GBA35]
MFSTKNFRLPVFVVAIAAFMILATVSIEAAPFTPGALCVPCPEAPECGYRPCPAGWYCQPNLCTCQIECKEGDIP